ncbi:DsrE family protein [Hyphobacterium sp.]|jgi:intracellular sulfur oxidation DsrE/DsrF family protein|uniref:DsrE family protein n=1 Tax=Hyphobacterium sp. TaxID=2004662 RepID=UPI003BA8D67B
MRQWALSIGLALMAGAAHGQDFPPGFSTGPVIESYGPVADMPGAEALPTDTAFRVAFDTADAAEAGELNRTLVSAARFINMHARTGMDLANIHAAVVIHGRAVSDVAQAGSGDHHPNAPLVAELLANNVEIYVCGQSAAYYGVTAADLMLGVRMSLSAMTAHAQLQQRGYTLNPF